MIDDSFARFGSDGRLTNLPGLDGLRGLAVAVVVCFHGGWGWARGGFLGVSLFFTLSGFLITSVLLGASSASGSPRSALAGFWVRRARRLLPVAWLTLAFVVVAGWIWAPPDMLRRLPADVVSSLANVANWRFLLAGRSYGELFGEPSPVLHFWSLAIEEQFYLVFPLVLIGLLAVCRRARRPMAMALGALAALSFSMPLVLGWTLDRTYYGTDARAGELLIGAVLAVLVSSEHRRQRLVQSSSGRSIASIGGTVAGAVSIVLWVVVDRRSSFVTGGGLALTALCSTALVLAAALPTGPVRRLVDGAPLRRLGHVSYAVYLLHWPIMVFLSLELPGWSRTVRFVVAVATSLVLAELSRMLIEQPIRIGRGAFGVELLALRVGGGQIVVGGADLGCGLARGGWRKYDGPERSPTRCDAWPTVYAKVLDTDHTDIAVVMSGQWELVDRRLPGDSIWRHDGDQRLDDYLRGEFLAATDVQAPRGAAVVWLSVPNFGVAAEGRTPADLRASHACSRVDRLNEIIAEVVAARPGVAELIDLAGWTSERVDDASIRADGAHFNDDKANPVGEWLGSQLTSLWQRKEFGG